LTFRVIRPLRLVTGALLAVGLAACGGGSSAPSGSGPSSTAEQLTHLAGSATQAQYTASYVFHQQSPDSTAAVKVWHAPKQLRVDVTAGSTTATLIVTDATTYSCSVTAKKRTCFTVGVAGRPAQTPFNVGPATLFTADLDNLAAHGTTYTVRGAGVEAAAADVPAATCFAVAPGLLTPQPQVKPGTYCLADVGLLTSVTYANGNSAHLTTVQQAPPTARVFTPYASPSPLPS
jgi:hypothetical protein